MFNMRIQPAASQDIVQMVKLYQSANTCSSINDITRWTKENMELYPQFSWVYIQRYKLIGAISGRAEEGNLCIYDLAVQKNYRGQGIGSKLLKKMCEIGKMHNYSICTLWVHYKNSAAIPFYYRHGFRLKGISSTNNVFGYPDGEDIVHLEKLL